LRLEIASKTDKKKMKKKNFIFDNEEKFFLTRKEKRTCPWERKNFSALF